MKIYTKTGDAGETGLFGGKRLPKSHIRIQAYGDVDELNSWIGCVRDQMAEQIPLPLLTEIQNRLFIIGSLLAAVPEKSNLSLPKLEDEDLKKLEMAIDEMEKELEPMRNFILPGGHVWVSQIHVARTVCRRAERSMVALHLIEPFDELLLRYMNRLSDYLFMLARYVAKQTGTKEIPWIAKKP